MGKSEGELTTWKNLGVEKMIILKWIFNKCNRAWTELVWLKIWIGGGLLWMRRWTFTFH